MLIYSESLNHRPPKWSHLVAELARLLLVPTEMQSALRFYCIIFTYPTLVWLTSATVLGVLVLAFVAETRCFLFPAALFWERGVLSASRRLPKSFRIDAGGFSAESVGRVMEFLNSRTGVLSSILWSFHRFYSIQDVKGQSTIFRLFIKLFVVPSIGYCFPFIRKRWPWSSEGCNRPLYNGPILAHLLDIQVWSCVKLLVQKLKD